MDAHVWTHSDECNKRECNVLIFHLTLWTPNYFCQTPVGARLIFCMLLLGAELIFANLPPGAGLFFEPGKRRDPSRALMPVTK